MKKRVAALFLVLMMGMSFSLSGLISAETGTDGYDAKLKEAEEAKKKAKERIGNLKEDIEELEANKDNILKYVKKIDKKVEKVTGTLELLNDQIKDSNKQLKKLEEEVEIAQNEQNEQYEKMRKRIKYMYENGSTGYMDVIFSAQSLGDFLNRSEYIEKISKYDSELFASYVQTKDDMERRRSEMEGKILEISVLKEEAKAEKTALKRLKANKKSEVGKLNTAISSADSKMRTFTAQVAKQEREIENLLLAKQREIEKQEAAKRSAQSAGGNPANPAAPASYAASAAGMRWPLRVKGRISSQFGSRVSPTEGASTNHQGLDIAVPEGTPIVAAADGTVVTAKYSASAGNFAMIYHGNSLYTVYMHASKLAVEENQEVKQGDVIAYVGSTGVSTGAHLHFGVSLNGVYVNPLNYVAP